ncbi:MAG TPA: MmcQ/YjbR family DNA-binding protein [Caulobacteraceae bacterium]|nr:MmcQ/YjbR family DNA-binding protein [Caulobacteraceae bacterium]
MAPSNAKQAEAELVAYALGFPGAWQDHPWDHTVAKVGSKIFVFFGGAAVESDRLSVTVKLPISAEMALTLPYVHKAGHGLWKAGWVQADQRSGEAFDLPTLKGWIDQSYRAVAPKKLVMQLSA